MLFECGALNRKENVAVFCFDKVAQVYAPGLQKKEHQFMFVPPFPVDTKMLPPDFQMEYIELQSDIQLKDLIVSLYQTSISPLLSEKYPSLHHHILFTAWLLALHTCMTKDEAKEERNFI